MGAGAAIENLQSHYGFTRMPFGRDVPPQALHRHPGHRETIARIQWCISQSQMGVITGQVRAGKTMAVRAALAQLESSRHQVIYISDPTIGMRGIQSQIVTALGSTPAFYSGVLAHQTATLLAGELDERSRIPVVVIDEAHLLGNTELESLRMLTNTEMDTGSNFALLLVGRLDLSSRGGRRRYEYPPCATRPGLRIRLANRGAERPSRLRMWILSDLVPH